MKPRNLRPRRGAAMTEWVLIVALVAIGTIGAVGFFGDTIRALAGDSAEALAGNDNVANTAPGKQSNSHRTLKDFGKYNPGGAPDHPGD